MFTIDSGKVARLEKMDCGDKKHVNPYEASTASGSSSFPGRGYSLSGALIPDSNAYMDNLSRQDQQAIMDALADDDDAGFAAALQNASFHDQSLDIFHPIVNPPGPSSSVLKITNSSKASDFNLLNGRSQKERSGISLVDPEWEIIDPTPDIWSLFNQFNKEYFWGKLTSVEVKWSKQMTSCAGICRYQSRAGYCSIGLSFPLLKFRPRKDLVETLLHEMIHAYLFVSDNDRDRESHGPFFHEHMYRINRQTGTKISVYHSFHDEVNHYKQHIWRCEGPCRNQRPYSGFVKRARNRAPSKNDLWWADHQAKCGGNFVKIHEPEGFGVKKKQKAQQDKPHTPLLSNQKTLKEFEGFKSPTKSKETLDKIDMKSLGKKLAKSPGKRQTVLSFPNQGPSSGSLPATSPSLSLPLCIDLTSPVKKRSKVSLFHTASGTSGPRRQLQLNNFFTSKSSQPVPAKCSNKADPEVVYLDS